ncbi:hypothetical protein NM688_g804 [Phlebia brevispora]|uniref:Uncharacterized protein n=1 Tax=Phlebia brevispora TaxID=194682 RepID=A0ACC1TDJ2_9APHY|nr:hypothetical protein NM688_g804 [Phlebia brevispora]
MVAGGPAAMLRRWTTQKSPRLCRSYHDTMFGYREPRKFTLPDYSPEQLHNRAVNAPLLRYVDSVRTHGHRAARIDPLDILQREEVAALDPTRYGLIDPSAKYDVNGILWTCPFGEDPGKTELTLAEITQSLRQVYVGRIAYEYMHSPSKTERLWFSHLLESQTSSPVLSQIEKKRIHELLVQSEVFDKFLQAKFPNLKRYGLEGGESMLPILDTLFRASAQAGITNIVLSMPHRGRLNLLTSLLEFSPRALFNKIRGGWEVPEELGASGDVISHLVASPTLYYENSQSSEGLKVTLLPNPSHLEAVNPVALGKTRAKQFSLLKTLSAEERLDGCVPGDRVMCVQLHGDASFTGQGIVMEGLGLNSEGNLPHFTVGGSVHIVVNNSIGYTTPAHNARSSLYCSDIGKMIYAPVLHVNGDYPEDVARAIEIAFKYRHFFRKDVIIDLIVYRRWGHNELDEPAFTQPLMYDKIRSRQSPPSLYESQLLAEQVLTPESASAVRTSYESHLTEELAQADSYKVTLEDVPALKAQWSGMVWPGSKDAEPNPATGMDETTLRDVGRASVAIPDGFNLHTRLQRHVKHRLQSLEAGKNIDWATAEALAFGSLMMDGYDIRISGQDQTEQTIVPLNDNLECDGSLELANSSLSELAVLGFEYGVSWERPDLLPIWEAQFGDFFNGAQIVIDTFVSSGETKWLRQSGLVLLLPHGLDGAGPEHSSSRIERWLQLTNDRSGYPHDSTYANVNMHVVFPTTPAQYFHLLRRQLKRNFRKPLIVAGPKTLLRLPAAASSLNEMALGTQFSPVLDDPLPTEKTSVKRVILCSGKLYYDLVKERQARGDLISDLVAFVRVEELCPFPFAEVQKTLHKYTEAEQFVWLQEEPRNQGAYAHVAPRIQAVLDTLGTGYRVEYRGRVEDAVPAPGIAKLYSAQQKAVLQSAFDGL